MLIDTIVDDLVASLKDDPDWEFDRWRAQNRRLKTKIWMANHRYGLSVTIDGHKWGDVTFASTLFGWAIPWRVRLYRATCAAGWGRSKPVLPPEGFPQTRARLQSSAR